MLTAWPALRFLAVRPAAVRVGQPRQGPNDYPGQRLGLPEPGPGSLARLGRRIGALMIDWFIAYGLRPGRGLRADQSAGDLVAPAVLGRLVVLGVVSVRLFGFTPGQFALGLRVASVDHRLHVGLGRALCAGC